MLERRRFLRAAAGVLAAGSVPSVAQQAAKVHRIGYLSPRATHAAVDDAFLRGMRELGYTIGRNLAIEYRWAGNDTSRLPLPADELVRLNVDVIVTASTAGIRAAMNSTRTIPIVMAASADPVGTGLVASLGRPGGNVTGIALQSIDLARKRLQLMREMLPGVTRVALLAERVATPAQGPTAVLLAETRAAAKPMGVVLVEREIARADELADAFAAFRRAQAQALIVQVGPLTFEHRVKITAMAAEERLPAMYEVRNFVDDGGFVSYGPDLAENYRRAAGHVDRILKGAKPGDLPVEQPDKLELVISEKAARALGVAIPLALLQRADEVIR